MDFEPVTKAPDPLVGGKVLVDGQPAAAGTTVELVRTDDGWKSGAVPLENGGLFFVNVLMANGQRQSTFNLTVRDGTGNRLESNVDSVSITSGMSVGKASLTQAVSIALADGSASVLLQEGVSLPATSEVHTRRFVRSLAAGSGDELKIPIQSGSEPESDLNLTGSVLVLKGTEIDTDIVAGAEVEIHAKVDESSTTLITFTIQSIGKSVEVKAESSLRHDSPQQMRAHVASVRETLDELLGKAEETGQPDATRAIGAFRESNQLDSMDDLVEAWDGGDAVAAGQARNQIVAAKKQMKHIAGLVEWPALLAKWEGQVDHTRRLVHETPNVDPSTLDGVIREGEQAIEAKDPRMLNRALDQLGVISMDIAAKDPAFWGGALAYVAQQQSRFSDQALGARLLEEGASAMRRGDGESLQSIVQQLFRLLPPDVVAQATGSSVDSDVG